ncbi:hypothetical protein HY772_00425 [Candidatus Woesearchaeota archaeon]|nr:hypothetical protein [Candidatus Woesearchaeota archaeon]
MESFVGKRTSPHMYDQHRSDALRASSLIFRHSQLVSGYSSSKADIPRWGIPLVGVNESSSKLSTYEKSEVL